MVTPNRFFTNTDKWSKRRRRESDDAHQHGLNEHRNQPIARINANGSPRLRAQAIARGNDRQDKANPDDEGTAQRHGPDAPIWRREDQCPGEDRSEPRLREQ